MTTFPPAGVLRANVASAGEDFEEVCRNIEARADGEGLVVRQLFLSLHEPWTGAAVDILGAHGYFLAGYAPRWFDHDALVLQKLTVEPGWDRMKVFADKAQRILELIRRDRERVRGLRGTVPLRGQGGGPDGEDRREDLGADGSATSTTRNASSSVA